MRLAFILGAGISSKLLPLSRELTPIALAGQTSDGRPVIRASDGSYLLGPVGPRPPVYPDYIPQVIALLGWLKARMFSGSSGDYELLYFGLQQIADALGGELDNPLLMPFIDEYAAEVTRLLDGANSLPSPGRFAQEAANYISGAVACALSEAVSKSDREHAHRPLLDACRDEAVTRCDVITLNHDTLLEESFRAAGMRVEDGFDGAVPSSEGWQRRRNAAGDLALWRGYRRRRRRVRLVKLHGSIDWWRIRPPGGSWHEERIARLAGSHYRLDDGTGCLWDAVSPSPLLLVGTFNKMLDYTRPFFLQSFAVFRRGLLLSDALVVSGYSFRDKGVNALIADWYDDSRRPGRPLMVIGPRLSPDNPPATARGAIANRWKGWSEEGRLTTIPSGFSDATWPSMRETCLRRY